MPLMSSIRSKLSTMFVVLAVLFVLMIIFEWGMDLSSRSGGFGGNRTGVIGEVNGHEIKHKDFAEVVRRTAENQKSQTGQDVDEETERQIRVQVWNQMVDEILINQAVDRLGIVVTDQEIRDVVNGPNPPEFLVQQFRDSTGTFRREAYEQAITNPQNRGAWVQVEDVLREQQKRQKLQSLLMTSVQASEGEVLQRYVDRNVTIDAAYMLFDVNRLVSDSAVTVTDKDIQETYERHPEDYKTKATRKLKYVTFSLQATAQDSSSVQAELQRIIDQAKSGLDFTELATTYSEVPPSDAFFKHGELSRTKEKPVFAAHKGEIVGPIRDADGFHIIKVTDERQGTQEFVNAAHILLRHVPTADSVRVASRIRDLAKQARSGGDFGALARANSEDGSAVEGGDLGWAARGTWVKPFEDAAFSARTGQVVGPVRTQFGWHVIKVLGHDRREVKITAVTMKVKPGSQTIDESTRSAEDFAYVAEKEGFEKAAEQSGYSPRETPEFTKEGFIPGIGQNDLVTAFAFNHDLNEISHPISVNGNLAVFKVSGVREEGLRPLDEVITSVRATATREKRMSVVRQRAEEFAKTLAPDADLVSTAREHQELVAGTTGPFKPTDLPPGIGRDPRFVGTTLALQPGKISAPFEGVRGYYIVRLLSRSAVDTAAFALQRSSLREQILQEKRNRFMSDWQRTLREQADIEDYRDQFYR